MSMPFGGEEAAREHDVLAGVGRLVLDEDLVRRDAQAHGDSRELIGLGFLPELPGYGSQAAGKDQEWCPAVQEQLGASFGDTYVVAAQHEDRIGFAQRLIELMVVPDLLDERPDPIVHSAQSTRYFCTNIVQEYWLKSLFDAVRARCPASR